MTVTAFLAYCLAITLGAATPGPAMFAVISNGLTRGFATAFLIGVGVAAADMVLVILAMLGLVALVQTFEWIFWVLKYAGAAYLIYLGVKMIRARAGKAPPAEEQPRTSRGKAFFLGASIGLGNPKAILFHASIMPLILDLSSLTFMDGVAVVCVVLAANVTIMGFYAWLSGAASKWFKTEERMRWINRISGGAMIGVGAVIASR